MDREIQCKDCQEWFTFTERDQNFYQEKGFSEPKRCAKCRVIKKSKFNDNKQFENGVEVV